MPVSDTVRSFREILDGTHDDLPESAFYKGLDRPGSPDRGEGRTTRRPEREGRRAEEPRKPRPRRQGDEGRAQATGWRRTSSRPRS